MHNSPKQFSEILFASRPTSQSSLPLTNLTFFLGAGFSKSWDIRFPVGNSLFSFTFDEWSEHGEILGEFLALNNYPPNSDLTASMFKDIVYQIGMMRKYPSIRSRYIDDQNLDMVERHLRYLIRKKFEKTAPLYYEVNEKLEFDIPPSVAQSKILGFFRLLERCGDGSGGLPEGIRSNFITTNYDFVIETILDNCSGPDDTYSLYSYRGVTPIKYSGRQPYNSVHSHWLVHNLLKINGGFEIFKHGAGFEFDYTNKRTDQELQDNPPQLMLASREQDYTQQYFHALFPKVVRLLQETRILVLVGYSIPEEDALLRLIIKQFAEDRADGDRKVIFYIDLSDEIAQEGRVIEIFPHANDARGLSIVPYSGSFSDWCSDVLSRYKTLSRGSLTSKSTSATKNSASNKKK